MADTRKVLDSVTLRFDGDEKSGTDLHELRAADVAQVLQGLASFVSDFDKAGAFHDEGPADSVMLVRPPQEGSFIIEAIRMAGENWEGVAAVTGLPSVATLINLATKSMRAEVQDFEHLENGNVKIMWQDDTVQEVSRPVWEELNKRKHRRKKQLREIMAPLGDDRVSTLDVSGAPSSEDEETPPSDEFVLTRADFDSVAPTDEVEESEETFEVDGQMQAIDFGDPTRWKVRAAGQTRKATVDDADFLRRVAEGLAISSSDIFRLRIRADKIVKNGRARTTWTVLKVENHRRRAGDGTS
ncbi:hypothetical protein [Rhodococcus sp. HS-D2]|uniref:hypothetical protein n=1 Tax=Rhodococcus sp. HS-D2 TaxID=1384636 RepID=UPI0007D9056E|nr:hypothetical protein [Rhodococcus sp. HS-D2]